MDPQVPQCSLQFWDVEWLLPLHLGNYEIPGIVNRVVVGKIAYVSQWCVCPSF